MVKDVAREVPKLPYAIRYERPAVEAPPAYYPPDKLPEEYTLKDARAGITNLWMDEGVRFMKPGESWTDAREPFELRETFLSYEEAKFYINEIDRASHVLVVIEKLNELTQSYEYEIWLDYEDVA